MKRVIKRRAAFAEIHQDTTGPLPTLFGVVYRKLDGTLGRKPHCSKSLGRQSGTRGYRGNQRLNHTLLLYDHDARGHFEIHIDLLVEFNNQLIDHTT